MILTDRVRIGLDTFSETDLISAEYNTSSSLTSRIYNILSANFSWVTTVFSLPSIIKYPPTSFIHSPMVCRISRVRPDSTQKSDWTITGNLPKYIFSKVIVVFWILPEMDFSVASLITALS